MNRIHVASWFVLTALAGLAGCESAKAPEPFPQATADAWLGAFNSGDVTGLALMYSEDSEVLPPDQPIVTGLQAVEEFWKSYNPGQVRLELSEVQMETLGEYWFREGSYTAKVGDAGDQRVGKFIELWKKSGSAWLLYRHMWSPNAPALAPGVPPTDEPA